MADRSVSLLRQSELRLEKNFQTQSISEGVSLLRMKSRDNVGTASVAGWPDRPRRADTFRGLVANFLWPPDKENSCWKVGIRRLLRALEQLPGWAKAKVAQWCPALCNPMDYTVRGTLQARILEWVAFPFSRWSSQPRDRTQAYPHCRQILYQLSHKSIREMGESNLCENFFKRWEYQTTLPAS